MKIYGALFALMTLAGCQSYVDAESEYTAYATCNHRNALRYSAQSGDALGLAVAAEASCPRETNALLIKLNEAKGPGGALRMMDQIRKSAVRSNAATIAKARS